MGATKKRSNTGEWRFVSPLRYPGGKLDLANYVRLIVELNKLHDMEYVEPYAGGASIALSLLYNEYARRIHINDFSAGVYAFWHSVTTQAERFAEAVELIPLSMDEWHRQREVQNDPDPDLFDLGFSTFFLNRTNRSGIIKGGVIGGQDQIGRWKLDARFNRSNLVDRIRRIGRYASRVSLTQLDAAELLRQIEPGLPDQCLLYLDPPYIKKGRELYTDYYDREDHKEIAALVQAIDRPWIVSYDYHASLFKLYRGRRYVVYSLSYHAQDRYAGKEIIFFSDDLEIPDVQRPTKIRPWEMRRFLARAVL